MRVEGTTDKMMDFLKKNGINLSELSRIAGIPYKLLYASVRDKNRKRELRTDEFLSICEAGKRTGIENATSTNCNT